MGADLYIEKLYRQNNEKYSPEFNKWVNIRDTFQAEGKKKEADEAQKKVSEFYEKMYEVGYFRDSYNGSSLFWILGLSWWQGEINGRSFITKKGEITPAGAKRLIKHIEPIEIQDLPEDWPENNHAQGTAAEWTEYFREKKQLFLKFLRQAIELNEPIRASV